MDSSRLARSVSVFAAVVAVAALLVPAAGASTIIRTPPPGTLVIDKVIEGDVAYSGEVSVRVQCVQNPDFGNETFDETITLTPGVESERLVFEGLPVPADCIAEEVDDGSTSAVEVESIGLPIEFVVNPNETYQLAVVNQLTTQTGTLRVVKQSFGNAAGERGVVLVQVLCTDPAGRTTETQIVIDPGRPTTAGAGDIVAGSTCTVTELDAGTPAGAEVTTIGSPREVVIEAGGSTLVTITNTYTYTDPAEPGALEVVKVVDDPAGVRSNVSVDVVCDGKVVATYGLPASAGEGTFVLGTASVPPGSVCSIIEPDDGSTAGNRAIVEVSPAVVSLTPGGTGTITVTNTYEPLPDPVVDVTVTKELAGDVGRQGPIVVGVDCAGRRAQLSLDEGATTGGSVTVTNVSPDETCRITERLDGANREVEVTTTGLGSGLDPAGSPFTVTNTYSLRPGSVRVVKVVDGEGAADRGDVTVAVDCTDGSSTSTTWAPGDAITDVLLTGVEDGATCTVTEPVDGSTASVDVSTTGVPIDVDVTAGAEAVVLVRNTYTTNAGALVVGLALRGNAEPFRDDVEVVVDCDGREPVALEAPTGERPGPVVLAALPYGTVCEVTQPLDGDAPGIDLSSAILPVSTVTIDSPAALAEVVDVYTAEEGVLTVTKELAGDSDDRGDVVLEVVCTSARTTATVPATDAPTPIVIDGLLPGDECTVTETEDGGGTDLTVATTFLPAPTVEVGPGEAVEVAVRNEYTVVAAPEPTDPEPTDPEPTDPADPVTPPDTLPVVGLPLAAPIAIGLVALTLGSLLAARPRRKDGEGTG